MARWFIAWFWLCLGASLPVFSEAPLPTSLYEIHQGESVRFRLPDQSTRIDLGTANLLDVFLPDPRTLLIKAERPGHCLLVIQFASGRVSHFGVQVLEAISSKEVQRAAGEIRRNLVSVEGISVKPEGPRVVIRGTAKPSDGPLYRSIIGVYGGLVVDQVKFATELTGATYDVYREKFQGFDGDLLLTDQGRYKVGEIGSRGRCLEVSERYAICEQSNGRLALILAEGASKS
jgi:hypothetical protein